MSALERNKETELTKPDQVPPYLAGRLSIRVKLRAYEFTAKEEYDAKEPYMQRLGCSSYLRPAETVVFAVL